MESILRVTRRGGVILVAVLSVACSLLLVYLVFNRGAISHLPTLHLVALVGSLLLPITTLGLLRLDQLTVRARGSGR
ncbi:MAG: hypothetical protein Q9O74_12385 [Planctomycetota bacterium]|nr:hypothetical protein [Planctomycetota bacterium]